MSHKVQGTVKLSLNKEFLMLRFPKCHNTPNSSSIHFTPTFFLRNFSVIMHNFTLLPALQQKLCSLPPLSSLILQNIFILPNFLLWCDNGTTLHQKAFYPTSLFKRSPRCSVSPTNTSNLMRETSLTSRTFKFPFTRCLLYHHFDC